MNKSWKGTHHTSRPGLHFATVECKGGPQKVAALVKQTCLADGVVVKERSHGAWMTPQHGCFFKLLARSNPNLSLTQERISGGVTLRWSHVMMVNGGRYGESKAAGDPVAFAPQWSSEGSAEELYVQDSRDKRCKVELPDERFRANISVPTEQSGS